MASTYEGMRWFKCDFQMQTPADRQHWQGDALIAGSEGKAAEAYARACYEAGLNAVGITEHNFLNKDFMPYLYEAFSTLSKEFNREITIFPGFEFEADVGKGMHVLCLFEPGTDLEDMDHILTECGVARPRVSEGVLAKSRLQLTDILKIVQKPNPDGSWRGIVIVPHIFTDSLFDNDRISEWIQREEFINPDLLAVEVPKPVEKMSLGFQRLFESNKDCAKEWRRARPIATIMSSDNKMLLAKDEDDRPMPNSIGYRYTWMKMSAPSIESLRQAFLDPKSRIRLPVDVKNDPHPESLNNHPHIKSVDIKGVTFLADQLIHFSPNMSSIIGGRGSGKSTVLEYLRLMLGKWDDLDRDTAARMQRIKDTAAGDGVSLTVDFQSWNGVQHRLIWNGKSPHLDGVELEDPKTFFKQLPAQFFSQQQLNKITQVDPDEGILHTAKLLELVNGFKANELKELDNKELQLHQEITGKLERKHQLIELEATLRSLKQEKSDLDRQWQARNDVQNEAKTHENLKAEKQHIDSAVTLATEQSDQISATAKALKDKLIPFSRGESPHFEWISELDTKFRQATEELEADIALLTASYQKKISDIFEKSSAWTAISRELSNADEQFSQACQAKGISTEDVSQLSNLAILRTQKQSEIDDQISKIESIKLDVIGLDEQQENLTQIWHQQVLVRQAAASKANTLAVHEESSKQFIDVSVKYQGDKKNFLDLWESFGPTDGRTKLGRSWNDLGGTLFSLFEENSKPPASIWKFTNIWFEQGHLQALGDIWSDVSTYIADNSKAWDHLTIQRVQDAVDIALFRPDGSLAGKISDGSLSDGQRNTAALALLLAQDGGPLIIDQPEDELDSNFVFKELIPMIRRVKSSRQLIVATHNANLPVNGDSDLVYAIAAKDGRGVKHAAGGLDQLAVTKAVLDIMEGTEEAFRRRREKYNF
ncbi:phosphoesterase [Pseudomonas straminea]|uniref:AAA domain-containing protein, putative AbiEii toxin, Type IV TA system n=1 Tax=Pseudomonas straminea TaxID=47882 RepID=A0A1I1V7A7_PSEOC|nr:AAA family ATPase [Pseudomonas straminea]GLX13678.1 phosphoesterase [Pseudomonas straminea]SFD78886.1 AAA domain-containing protein, putative AbiEii toxin, Type IV TA system [Pseudomonas straminea]